MSCWLGVVSGVQQGYTSALYNSYRVALGTMLLAGTLYRVCRSAGDVGSPVSSVFRLSLDRCLLAVETASALFSIYWSSRTGGQQQSLAQVNSRLREGWCWLAGDLTAAVLLSCSSSSGWAGSRDWKSTLVDLVSTGGLLTVCHQSELQLTVQLDWISSELDRLTAASLTSFPPQLDSLIVDYNRLLQQSADLSQLYGKQILLFAGNIFILTTNHAYIVVEGLIGLVMHQGDSRREEESEPLRLLALATLLSLRLIEIYRVISSCEAVRAKSKEFRSALYQLTIEHSIDTSLHRRLRLHLTAEREPVFSAFGFFPIDFTLLHSMMGTATTYLVILLQFPQNSEESRANPGNTSLDTSLGSPPPPSLSQ